MKSAIFFTACLVVILVLGLMTEREMEEEQESPRGYADASDDGLGGLSQMES